jgi:hypothetical protein
MIPDTGIDDFLCTLIRVDQEIRFCEQNNTSTHAFLVGGGIGEH